MLRYAVQCFVVYCSAGVTVLVNACYAVLVIAVQCNAEQYICMVVNALQ